MGAPKLLRVAGQIQKLSPWLKKHLLLVLVIPLALLILVLIVVSRDEGWSWTPLSILLHVAFSLLIGTTFLYFALKEHLATTKLFRYGSHTFGTVIDKKKKYFDEDGFWFWPLHYYITYAFTPRTGELLTDAKEVPKSLWKTLEVGNTVGIAFDLASQTRSILTPTIGQVHLRWQLFGIIVIAMQYTVGVFFVLLLFKALLS